MISARHWLLASSRMTTPNVWTRIALYAVLGALIGASMHANAASPTLQILDRVDAAFRPLQNTWYSAIKGYAQNLFWLLVLVDMGWSAVIYALEKSDFVEIVTSLVKKIFTIGFFWALLKLSDTWIPAIINSFRKIGTDVGNVSSVTPDGIASTGFELAKSAFQIMRDLNTLEAIAVVFPVTLVAILMFLAFLFVAAQLLVTLIEAYLCVGAGVILLGFGGSRWTTDFATKYLQYAVGTGLKLMILYLVVGAGQTLFDQIMLDPNNLIESCLAAVGSSLVYAYLAIQIPAIAQAMTSGSPSLTAGGLAGSAVALGAAIAGAGAATAAATSGTAAGVGGAAAGGTGLAKALGAGVSSGLDAGKSGVSLAAHAVGEVAKHGMGLATGAIGSAVDTAKTAFAEKVDASTGGQIASSIEATRGGSMSSGPGAGGSSDSNPATPNSSGSAAPATGTAPAPGVGGPTSNNGPSAGSGNSTESGAGRTSKPQGSAPAPSASSPAMPNSSGSATPATATASALGAGDPAAAAPTSPGGDASGASISGGNSGSGANTQDAPRSSESLSDRIQKLQGYVPQDMAGGGGTINLDLHHTQD